MLKLLLIVVKYILSDKAYISNFRTSFEKTDNILQIKYNISN